MENLVRNNYYKKDSTHVHFKYESQIKEYNHQNNTYDLQYPLCTKISNNLPLTPNHLFDHNIWILNSDFNENEHDTQDEQNIYLIQIQVTSLFDEVCNIINEKIIDESDRDENFIEYLNLASNGVQLLISMMFENMWTFEPMVKFTWIYFMLACKYEPRAIKYLLKSSYFIPDIVTKKDKVGNSALLYAIQNIAVDTTIELKEYLTKQNLEEIYIHNKLVNYGIYNLKVLEYVLNNVEDIDINSDNTSILIQSILYNPDATPIILKSKVMSISLMNKYDSNNVSCLMYAMIYTKSLFETLLESAYCTQELVDHCVPIYGNILNIAARSNNEFIDVILNSKFMNKSLLFNNIELVNSMRHNIFFDIYEKVDILKKVIFHKFYDPDIFLTWLPNLNIITELAYNNIEAFRLLIENEKINLSSLISSDTRGINTIILGAITNVEILKIIYRSKYWSNTLLTMTYLDQKNILMLLLEDISKDNKFIVELYCNKAFTKELLFMEDDNNINTFCYICIHYGDIAINIIDTEENQNVLHNYVNDAQFKLLCYRLHGKNNHLLKLIINKCSISVNNINAVDNEYGNNFYMETCIFNPDISVFLIENNLVNQETIMSINIDKDNCLNLLLKQTKKKSKIYNAVKKLLSTGLVNSQIINNRNLKKECPFLLACMINYGCVKIIMDSEYFDVTTFENRTLENLNCFTYSCKSGDINVIKLICDHPLLIKASYNMFSGYDSSGVPHIYYALINGTLDIMKYIVSHHLCNSDLLTDAYKLLLIKNNITCTQLECILESIYCTSTMLLHENLDGNNCLAIAVNKNNIKLVEKILNSDKFTKELFLHQNFNKSIFMDYIKDNKIMTVVMTSPNFSDEILTLVDNDNCNILVRLMISHEYEMLKYIIESGKCSVNAVIQKNNNHESILTNLFNMDLDIVDVVLSNINIQPTDLLVKDNNGNTCLHKLAQTISDKKILKLEAIEKILNLDKCSTELFMAKNNDGNTFLLVNPNLLEYALNSKYCSKEFLKESNKDGVSIFNEVCTNYQEFFKTFINHPLFDSSFLTEPCPTAKTNMISYLCINSMGNLLDILFESNVMTDDIINYVDELNYTPLIYTILTKSLSNTQQIINSKFNLSKSFHYLYNDNKNLLMIAALGCNEVFDIIINCKYVTKDMYYFTDRYNHNVVIYAITKNLWMTKSVMESKLWENDLLFHCDIDSDYLVIHAAKNPDVVKYLLDNMPNNYSLIQMTNKIGKTCAHYYAKENDTCLNILLKSNKCTSELINRQDNYGDTCLHVACKYNLLSLNELLSSSYLTEELILKKNNNGHNAFTLLLFQESINTKLIVSLFDRFNSRDLLVQQDKDGNTILFYAARFCTSLLKNILKYEYCDETVLSIRNNNNITCYMYACQFNGKGNKNVISTSKYDK